MTVADLIKLLADMPRDAPVLLDGDTIGGAYRTAGTIGMAQADRDPNTGRYHQWQGPDYCFGDPIRAIVIRP